MEGESRITTGRSRSGASSLSAPGLRVLVICLTVAFLTECGSSARTGLSRDTLLDSAPDNQPESGERETVPADAYPRPELPDLPFEQMPVSTPPCVEDLPPVDCVDFSDEPWDGCDNGNVVEFRVSAGWEGVQNSPKVQGLIDDTYVVVWVDREPLRGGLGLMARILRPSGGSVAPEWLVQPEIAGLSVVMPDLAAHSSGAFAVIWGMDQRSLGSEGDPEPDMIPGVYARTYASDGTAISDVIHVSSTVWVPGGVRDLRAAFLGDDRFLVTWTGGGVFDWHSFGRLFHSDGEPDGFAFHIGPVLGDQCASADLAYAGDDTLLVAWHEGTIHNFPASCYPCSIAVGVLDPKFGDFSQTVTIASLVGVNISPRLALNSDGLGAIMWTQKGCPDNRSCYGVSGRLLNGDGSFVSDELHLSEPVAVDLALAVSDEGEVLFIWASPQKGLSVYLRRMSMGDSEPGCINGIGSYANSSGAANDVTFLSGGGYVVVWCTFGQDGDDQGVFAQRFDASGNKVHL